MFLDWNPTNKFWFHEELQGDNDTDFIILTYEDNEACPQSAIDFILKAKQKAVKSNFWENWYNVYGKGLIGNLEGVVFSNWDTIDTLPKDAKYLGSGMDFGYTNDTSTLVDDYRYNGEMIFHESIYRTGVLHNELARLWKKDIIKYSYSNSAEAK